jgi:hypothetical protein
MGLPPWPSRQADEAHRADFPPQHIAEYAFLKGADQPPFYPNLHDTRDLDRAKQAV